MKKLTLFYVMVFIFTLTSCEKDLETPLQSIVYQNQIIEGSTNSDGKIEVKTTFPDKEITFNIKVVDSDSIPIKDMNVSYYQYEDKSVIFINDPKRRYNSAFLYGPPVEFEKIAGLTKDNDPGSSYQSKSVLLTIGLLITVGAIATAEIKIIKNAWVIQKFYISDAVVADKDYILYCKTFIEIAELIKARTGIALDASSILISFVTAGGGSSAVEISRDILEESAESIRDKFINLAIERWGMTMNQLLNRKVAVKVYPFDRDENFANIKNLYALYEIDYENPVCDDYINDVPYQVNNILTEDLLNTFEEKGFVIHKGFTPPDITGNYFLNELTNLETGVKYTDYSYQFFNQEEDFSIELKYASSRSDALGKGAFISGDETNFSVYCQMEDNIDDDGTAVYIKTLDIYSAEVTSEGLKNYQNGFIIVDKKNDVNGHFMNVGESRIVYEADGVAEKVATFPYSGKGEDIETSKYKYIK